MRVTGGIYRNHRLKVPLKDIRPTTDRLREAIFSLLISKGVIFNQIAFLDLFSGSGAVGVEAASRGAVSVSLVERDHGKKRFLLHNTRFVDSKISIHIIPAELFLMRQKRQWDVIFIDPPYRYKYKKELLSSIVQRKLLSESSIVMVHSSVKENLMIESEILCCFDRRQYGGAILWFFQLVV